ncbi:MAG: hypothetical protein K2N35_08570, partial [Muribaculaceae bacterium]|nr:hypothetical protein [Muribaculaceae bacterium]
IMAASFATSIMFAQEMNPNDRALWGSVCGMSNATYYKESLDKMLLSWRMLPGDKADTAFDLYRKVADGKEEKLNKEPIFATNFQDLTMSFSGRGGGDTTYRLTYAGSDETIGLYVLPNKQRISKLPYISIPLTGTADVCDIAGMEYQANDVSVGDLDGDGQMEVIVKRLLSHDGNDGTGSGESPLEVRHTVLYEAYKLDGTMLWRVCSGPNIILGNSSSFAIADFDGDGKAEMAIKTGEGTIFGDGMEIGDTDGDGKTDYRTKGANYIGSGPEFFSIIDGISGKELARADFIKRGRSEEWGDNYYKRAHSLRVGVGYFDGELPSVILGRGVYAKSVIEAWDYRDGKLTRRWQFNTDDKLTGKDGLAYSKYAGQGNHSLSVGDVDGDGFDEIVYGAMTVDHDGVGLYSSCLGHGDALHLGKFDPSRPGLQIFSCFETGRTEVALRDAADGTIIYDHKSAKEGDMGRAMIADIDPYSPGCELWWYKSTVHDINGNELSGDRANYPGSTNFAIWFDGSLNRQVFTGTKIDSRQKGRVFTIYRYDVTHINGTKENPCFYGDILGDWREELIFPTYDKTQELRIFSTWIPTDHRIPWLMTDHVYEMSALNQNIGYNQPTHTGYYLGSDYKSDEEIWASARVANGDTNGVEEISSNNALHEEGVIYDLMGRKIENPSSGIYILNGKKFVVK